MSLTLPGWILLLCLIGISAPLVIRLRFRGFQRVPLDVETVKAGLQDIGAQLKLGKLSEAEADAARLSLLARPRLSRAFGQDLWGAARTLVAPAAVFVLVACVGAALSYVEDHREVAGSAGTSTSSLSGSASEDEAVSHLADYARSIAAEKPEPSGASAKPLPDVNTMIERLAARLEASPDDIKGWRMLGWSYFHTGSYKQAAAAFARAVGLDPNSAELKLLYDEAKAKVSEGDPSKAALTPQAEAVAKADDGRTVERMAEVEAMPPLERDAAIRSMVDGLADRLETSPRDLEGWARLMRSRVVLGERELATTAFRKALEVFKDDAAASDKITAAAMELGLKLE